MTPSCSNSRSAREGPTKPHIGPSRKSHARYHLYPSLEQQWAYYARHIDFMLREPASQPYLDLRSLVGHKDYFILSTNVDTQVEKTFPAERVCNYQGSFAHLQCKQPCCDELFDAGPYIERMLAGMAGFEIRSEDVPRCPHCGWQLVPWVRDDTFLQGAAWREGLGRYERFVRERGGGRVLLLELGVGEMTPASSRSRSGAWPQSCRMRIC